MLVSAPLEEQNMRKIWKKITGWLFGFTQAELEDYKRRFPRCCMICSFHAWGYSQGMTDDPTPPPHTHDYATKD